MDKEIWKNIEKTNYAVSNLGRVKNLGTLNKKDSRGRLGKRSPKILKNQLNENTYLITFKSKLVHRLVALAFIPNPNNLPQVNHKDGNKLNNHVDNLEWCTSSYNIQHSYDIGLAVAARGEKSGGSKLLEEEVIEIRKLYNIKKLNQYEIAKKFKIGQQQVSRIINNKQWKYVQQEKCLTGTI